MEDRVSGRYTAGERPQPNDLNYGGRHHGNGGPRQYNGRDYERGPPRGGGRGMHRNYAGPNMYYHPQQGPPPYYNHHGTGYQHNQRRWHDWRHEGAHDSWRQNDRHPLDFVDPEMIALLAEENIAPLKRRSLRFPNAKFFCRSCEFHCDDLQSCKNHIESARHDRHATERLFNKYLKNLPPASDAMAESVGEVIMRVSQEFGLPPQERERRLQAVAELQQKLQESVPDATLELTGSMYSGLALRSSDVNASLVLPQATSHCEPIMELLRILKLTPSYSSVVNDLRSPSFPCVSYYADEYECTVVVGIWSASVRAMGRLMATFAAIDERFVHLARALLHWAKLCGISNQKKGSLPSIAYAVLVAHFLQETNPPILPITSELCQSVKPEDFPPPEEMATKFVSRNRQSLGELWLGLVKYLGYGFQFSHYDINLTTAKLSMRTEKHSKKICILDPFNPKKSLSRTINSAVSDYIMDKLFKALCRYFCVPQLSYGQLFFTLTVNNDLIKERRSRAGQSKRGSISESSESDNNKSSDYDLAIERLERLKTSSDCEPETREIASADELSRPFDTVTFEEATRVMKLLEARHLKYDFDVNLFTEGEQCPVYCSLCQKEGHVRDDCEEEKLPDLIPLPEKDEEIEKLISHGLNMLLRDLEPSLDDMRKRDQLVQNLQTLVNSVHKYGDAVLQLFGSSDNGFGFRDSDLDICITFKDDCHKDSIEQNFLMAELCSLLKNSGVFSNVHSIPQAKVPIVKFRCSLTGIDGDLSLYNTLALRNTKLLYMYSRIDPRVKLLGYGLKYFAKICDICDASRGSLSSYAFTLMLIHFLQHTSPPVVPVLQELYDPEKGQPDSVEVEGWETWFYSDLENLNKVWPGLGANKSSVGELWLELFRYYTEVFDFDDCVVTIRQFAPLTRLKKLWNTRTIAIEDPFNLSHNLGGALSAKMNTFIRKAFINGRHLYGGVLKHQMSPQSEPLVRVLFDKNVLTNGSPPNDRGCRRCGKIGHIAKNCTNRRESEAAGKKTRGKAKNNAARKEEAAAAAVRDSGSSKKWDSKSLIGERGMQKINDTCPPDTQREEIKFSEVLDILKKLLVDDQNRVDVLVSGYRVYTINWFCSLTFKEKFTLMEPDELLENKEPLVIIKVKSRPISRAEDDYVIGFLKQKNYFDEYVVDMSLEDLKDDEPCEGMFLRGLTDLADERKMKHHQKQQARRDLKKLRKAAEKSFRKASYAVNDNAQWKHQQAQVKRETLMIHNSRLTNAAQRTDVAQPSNTKLGTGVPDATTRQGSASLLPTPPLFAAGNINPVALALKQGREPQAGLVPHPGIRPFLCPQVSSSPTSMLDSAAGRTLSEHAASPGPAVKPKNKKNRQMQAPNKPESGNEANRKKKNNKQRTESSQSPDVVSTNVPNAAAPVAPAGKKSKKKNRTRNKKNDANIGGDDLPLHKENNSRDRVPLEQRKIVVISKQQ